MKHFKNLAIHSHKESSSPPPALCPSLTHTHLWMMYLLFWCIYLWAFVVAAKSQRLCDSCDDNRTGRIASRKCNHCHAHCIKGRAISISRHLLPHQSRVCSKVFLFRLAFPWRLYMPSMKTWGRRRHSAISREENTLVIRTCQPKKRKSTNRKYWVLLHYENKAWKWINITSVQELASFQELFPFDERKKRVRNEQKRLGQKRMTQITQCKTERIYGPPLWAVSAINWGERKERS